MRPHRIVRGPRRFLLTTAVLSLTLTTSALLTGACTTGAIGIAQCREIGMRAARPPVPCGVIDDVDACQRFLSRPVPARHRRAQRPHDGSAK